MTSQHPHSTSEGIDLKDGGDDLAADMSRLIADIDRLRLMGVRIGNKDLSRVLTRCSERSRQILNNIVNTKTGSGQ